MILLRGFIFVEKNSIYDKMLLNRRSKYYKWYLDHSYFIYNGIKCLHHFDFIIYSILMYVSYLLLFVKFFIDNYYTSNNIFNHKSTYTKNEPIRNNKNN
jgi:hypothetical protein